MDTIQLNNGVTMPLMGLGVFQVTDQQVCKESVLSALQTGYRLIDTAACYGNEKAVGEAIRESRLDRKELFLTSKVWIQDAGYEKTMRSFEKTLENLGTDYLDLYLIHMPYSDYHGSWRATFEMVKANVYDIFRAILSVAVKTCKGDPDAVQRFFVQKAEQIPSSWSAAYDKAKQHNDAVKMCLEQVKLDAIGEIKENFAKIWEGVE